MKICLMLHLSSGCSHISGILYLVHIFNGLPTAVLFFAFFLGCLQLLISAGFFSPLCVVYFLALRVSTISMPVVSPDKRCATYRAGSERTIIFFVSLACFFRGTKVHNHSSKCIPSNIENGMNIRRKDNAVVFRVRF